jgi:hypothetical protein
LAGREKKKIKILNLKASTKHPHFPLVVGGTKGKELAVTIE